MSQQGNITINDNKDKIAQYFNAKSKVLSKYIQDNNSSSYFLIRKTLSYADLISAAKRTKEGQSYELDLLLYLTPKEEEEVKNKTSDFGITKQSNITMPKEFYKELGIEQLKRRRGLQSSQHNHIIINNYANVYLVNESLKYFTEKYTKKVITTLNKKYKWENLDLSITLNSGVFSPINLTHAIHGIGTKDDTDFYNLRHNMFRGDALVCLIEKRDNQKNLFLYLEKNPIFFSICGLANDEYVDYLKQEASKINSIISRSTDSLSNEEEEITRKYQNKWRTMLAEESMNYSSHDNEVICAFTWISAKYQTLGPLFVASHIKRFENCIADEAFDINNGLLLVANADALFDKFLITVGENKEIIFSFLLENNNELKHKLLLDNSIVKPLLNEKRMKYMKWHREQFELKENERKKRITTR